MTFRIILLVLAVGFAPCFVMESEAQRRPASQSVQPKVKSATKAKAVQQLRSVRNQLAHAERFQSQRHASASASLRRAQENERAIIDLGLRPKDPRVRAARVQTLNAQSILDDVRSDLSEARRQTRAANRTLSLAKRGDWVAAHASVGAKNPVRPKPRLRKITFAAQPLGPTPNGSGVRKGILKQGTIAR